MKKHIVTVCVEVEAPNWTMAQQSINEVIRTINRRPYTKVTEAKATYTPEPVVINFSAAKERIQEG